jgi:DNA ligase-1
LTAAAAASLLGGVTSFREIATLCEALAQTGSRRALAQQVADFLAGVDEENVRPAVRLLLGQAGRGEIAVSGATLWPVLVRQVGSDRVPPRLQHEAVDFGQAVECLLRERPSGTEPPLLSVREVEDRIRALGGARGPGSRARKERLLADLFALLTPLEAKYVAKNLIREMRTGAAEGVVLDALALLAGGDRRAVERAHQSLGDLADVAARVLAHRGQPLPPSTLAYFRPLRPMLAQSAESASEALAAFAGTAGIEEKLDGARVQLHREGQVCRLYSRRLQELTPSLPDVVAAVVQNLAAPAAILEGEVVPVDAAGRPLPFQELMRRFRRVKDVERLVAEVPVRLELFDALQVGDASLLDCPYRERWTILERVRGGLPTVRRLVPEGRGGGRGVLRPRGRGRPRGRHGEGPRRALHARRAGTGLAQGEAGDERGSRHRRGRSGLRAPPRLAQQLPSGRA